MEFSKDAADSIVSSWLADNCEEQKILSKASPSFIDQKSRKASTSAASIPSNDKLGLGFSKVKSQQYGSVDPLNRMVEVGNNKKRKASSQDESAKNTLQLSHGVAENEEMIEDSRTGLKLPVLNKRQHNQKDSVKQGSKSVFPPKTSESVVQQKDIESSSQITEAKLVPATDKNLAAPEGDTKGKRFRKRKKTRSKQKNIRRDNRPENQRPEHLKLSSGDSYKGRQLTEQTKSLLGITN